MKITLTNVSVDCTASLQQWRIMSDDPPGIMFVEFFHKKYLLAIHNGNTHPPALFANKALDEIIKINELGPKFWQGYYITSRAHKNGQLE